MRTQYQVQNETQIRRNQRVIKNDNDQLIVKKYPRNKKQPIQQQPKLPICPSCKRNNSLEFDKGYYCKNCEFIISRQKQQIDKNVLGEGRDFPTRLNYANTKIREIYIIMVNTTHNSSEDMVNKLQSLKGKTKLKFYKNISNYYIEMKNKIFQTHHEDRFTQNAQGISKIYHEVLLLMKISQTKPEVKNKNINYYDLFYTVIKVRDGKKDIDNQYENDDNDYINFNDIVPNHHIGIKPRETILRQVEKIEISDKSIQVILTI